MVCLQKELVQPSIRCCSADAYILLSAAGPSASADVQFATGMHVCCATIGASLPLGGHEHEQLTSRNSLVSMASKAPKACLKFVHSLLGLSRFIWMTWAMRALGVWLRGSWASMVAMPFSCPEYVICMTPCLSYSSHSIHICRVIRPPKLDLTRLVISDKYTHKLDSPSLVTMVCPMHLVSIHLAWLRRMKAFSG